MTMKRMFGMLTTSKWMKVISIITAASILLTLTACGGSASQQDAGMVTEENSTIERVKEFPNEPGYDIVPGADILADDSMQDSDTDEPIAVNVGDEISFGKYPQNADGAEEPIVWQVLDVKNNKALVISKYCLDYKLYNEDNPEATWETCSLRAWLNNDFINMAFSEEEQVQIEETAVENKDNPIWGTDGGNDTTDKVFLLSLDETLVYFNLTEDPDTESHAARMLYCYGEACSSKPTEYAVSQGAYQFDTGNTEYWLRSTGSHWDNAAAVGGGGEVIAGTENLGVSIYVSRDANAVRPALWIDLNGGATAAVAQTTDDSEQTPSDLQPID